MISGLQLLVKRTTVVRLADWRGFSAAAGDILPQVEVSLSPCVAQE